jgi:hypothetical protein
MSAAPNPRPSSRVDYRRLLPPLVGCLLLIALGNGVILWLRGIGFWVGILGFLGAAGLVMLLIGGFAVAGTALDRRLGHELTFRLIGAALGFVVLILVLYRLSAFVLPPDLAHEGL